MGIKNWMLGLYATPWAGCVNDDDALSVGNCISVQQENMALALAIPDFDEPAPNLNNEPICFDTQFYGND
ncbi:hypothetical protein [Burkholderia pseudomallei]|uniref:hypothetical protein n=1 Tax=Burkholderia pseudomallei TaxID=28450 RepID=UPI0011CD9D83|nr:hypothetical protein [Burkholderia pseudomallei]